MTTAEIKQKKNTIRQQYKLRRAELDEALKSLYDKNILDNILSSQSFKYSDTVLLFHPLANEVNLLPLFDVAKALGKKVAFPKCFTGGVMKFYFTDDLKELQKGKYGIYEPKDTCTLFEGSVHPLCIVPCLCADKSGMRLGYGKGFYDRFLKDFEGISACVVYEEFISEKLPSEKRYDKKCDLIITQKEVLVVG